MGHGHWTREDFLYYSAARGRNVNASGMLDSRLTDRELFMQRRLHRNLDPRNVIRECCDTQEHPESLPVILALDVTGSMGAAAAEVAKKLNGVMTRLYDQVRDVEFMVMGIGDLFCDQAPIQISQFESDIRIAEQLDQIFLEYGGGGNGSESYTAAWYMGLNHTRLDCWKRGKKGLIITMGDEPLNPCLPRRQLAAVTGDDVEGDVITDSLYDQVTQKFEVFHLHVTHREPDIYLERVLNSFGKQLPKERLKFVEPASISDTIIDIVKNHAQKQSAHPTEAGGNEKADSLLKKLIFW